MEAQNEIGCTDLPINKLNPRNRWMVTSTHRNPLPIVEDLVLSDILSQLHTLSIIFMNYPMA